MRTDASSQKQLIKSIVQNRGLWGERGFAVVKHSGISQAILLVLRPKGQYDVCRTFRHWYVKFL